jgi:isoquinoline 1-oxidoreductase subunit beta
MANYFDMNRREFLRHSGLTGAMIIGTTFAGNLALAAGKNNPAATDANLFIALLDDGRIDITCHRSEMGQHTRTAITQILADELEADWKQINVVQATGDAIYGDQNTDGSKSIRTNFTRLRNAAATLRQMLEQAAARRWRLPQQQCQAELGRVIHSSGKSFSYAELAADLKAISPPSETDITLKPAERWRYINKGIAAVDMDDILTGVATYGADIRVPNCLVAVIARPPVVGSEVQSYDASTCLKVAGVKQIVELPVPQGALSYQPLGGIAVVATNTWAAMEGRRQLEIEWRETDNDSYDSAKFRLQLEQESRSAGDLKRNVGDVDSALASAEKRIEATYYTPHLAHAPMEPPTATADYKNGKVEVWSACQNPQADRATIASVLGMSMDDITVNVTLLGGAFGRKSKPDFSAEAAWLSREIKQAVRVQWSREDDIQHGFYHAVAGQYLEGGFDSDNQLTAWRHNSTATAINSTFTEGATEAGLGDVSLGLVNTPLQIPNIRMATGRAPGHVRIGWMRSVGNIYHCFAAQSFLAELAHSAGRDHRDFLLDVIGEDRIIDFSAEGTPYSNHGASPVEYPYNTARLKHVLRRVTEMAGWGRSLPEGSALGLAIHRSFLTYVATVVEINVTANGDLEIPAAWVAVDAGTVVNPDSVKNQMQGGSVFGLSCALNAEITASAGKVEQSNYHDYKVARMREAPNSIEVDVIASSEPPAGVGEPGTPPFAPALCNAIFNATGLRIRELPIGDQLRNWRKNA